MKIELDYSEANLLFSLLKREIEALQNSPMGEADKNYILNDYSKLLRKLESTKNSASEYDGC